MTRADALAHAQDASARHDKIEDRLLQLEVIALTRGVTDDELEEQLFLWCAHDVVERETITAYATLHLIDPEAMERLRNGQEII